MSKEQFDNFVNFVSKEYPLPEAAKATPDLDEFVKTVHWHAKQNGYDFTEDEIKLWLANQGNQLAAGELSDSQLEAGAGAGLNQYVQNALTSLLHNMK